MAYNPFTGTPPIVGTSMTGLDQIVGWIAKDKALPGRTTGPAIAGGATAADGLIKLIAAAAAATGAASDGIFTPDEVLAMNAWIRSDPQRLATFTALHGDDEGSLETGFHLVQGDGGATKFRGENAINTVADGLFHIGFAVQNGRFVNEDGNANASVDQVAQWLTALWTDHSTTGTGLDRITDMIVSDKGLAARIPEAQIGGGAEAANGINGLIAAAVQQLGLATDGIISDADVLAVNTWIRSDPARLAAFTAYHGDDEGGVETGFHLVQGDGGSTGLFGRNAINTIFDGIFHIGFNVQNGRFLNEDSRPNAAVKDVASWLDYFYTDKSTTGTGLDFIVDAIGQDRGLASRTSAADINAGARAANGLTTLLAQGLAAVGATSDCMITPDDLRALNAWIRQDAGRLAQFTALHGDDANGVETGFHLVQGDGGSLRFEGQSLIDTVADGIFHFGFAIQGERFVNEDGNANASLGQVATWLNEIYLDKAIAFGGSTADTLVLGNADDKAYGLDGNDTISGRTGNDSLFGGKGCDLLYGGDGNDRLDGAEGADQLIGGAGDDLLLGGAANDTLCGGDGNDTIDGGAGNDAIQGGDGIDTVTYATATAGVVVNLSKHQTSGGAGNDTISGVENVVGSSLDDTFVSDGRANHFTGNGGVDTVSYESSNARVRIDLGAGTAFDGAMTDALTGIRNATGSRFADMILGDGADNVLKGGRGADIMTGGAGADVFVFQNLDERGDTITDFAAGTDRIQFSKAAFGGLSGLVDGINFISSGAPAPTGAGPAFLYNSQSGVLSYDADGTGSGKAVMLATLGTDGHPILGASDIVFI